MLFLILKINWVFYLQEKDLTGASLMLLEPYDEGPVGSTFDVTTSNGSPALLAFIAGEQAIYWSQKPVRIICKHSLF